MSLLAPAFGAGIGIGTLVVLYAVWRAGDRHAGPVRAMRKHLRPGLAATSTGGLVYALTGWPVLGLLAGIGVVIVPRIMSSAQRRGVTERSEAVARWIEMLRDTIAGAAGLEEAVAVTARRPPPAIRGAVERLATRLHHQALPTALVGFATDVDDPGAELLVAALITAATNETRDLSRLLSALADTTRAQARMRHSIDAGRAQVRSATRLVVAITLLFIAALLMFSREYLAPYATVIGQLWLTIVGATFFAALALLVRLDRVDLPQQQLVSERNAPPRGSRRMSAPAQEPPGDRP
jgi:Flp pilus assembly protein TadB